MKRLFAFIALMLLGSAAYAVTVSSTTASLTGTPPLYLHPRESLTYTVSGTFTGRTEIQKSRNLQVWEPVGISTTNNAGGTFTGVIFNDNYPGYFRFQASTITAGSFVTELRDNDDQVAQMNNRKGVPTVRFFDDTMRLSSRIVFDPTVIGSSVILSSMTSITPEVFSRTFNVITSSGGAINMFSKPTIATTTAQDGELYIIACATNTITFHDNNQISGTLLELGANNRVLGVGDFLWLMFRAGSWYEMFYANN